jgi:hypothetical protein
MTKPRAIRVVIPDTGPLVSLAVGDALDLLLAVSDDVRIVITDVVEFEATHRAEAYIDGAAINAFLHAHAPRVEVMPTTVGQLALADARRRAETGEAWTLPKDLGELSITNFVISLRTVNPGDDPMLVLTEDDWFAANAYALPGNVHLLSTAAFLDGLEAAGRIPSAAAVRARIQAARPHFKADWVLDRPAEKIAAEWRSRVKRKRR